MKKHSANCTTHAGHLTDGHYCCDEYAADYIWGGSDD